jgi:hypothetical protein
MKRLSLYFLFFIFFGVSCGSDVYQTGANTATIGELRTLEQKTISPSETQFLQNLCTMLKDKTQSFKLNYADRNVEFTYKNSFTNCQKVTNTSVAKVVVIKQYDNIKYKINSGEYFITDFESDTEGLLKFACSTEIKNPISLTTTNALWFKIKSPNNCVAAKNICLELELGVKQVDGTYKIYAAHDFHLLEDTTKLTRGIITKHVFVERGGCAEDSAISYTNLLN